jgi:hypothetical protein
MLQVLRNPHRFNLDVRPVDISTFHEPNMLYQAVCSVHMLSSRIYLIWEYRLYLAVVG